MPPFSARIILILSLVQVMLTPQAQGEDLIPMVPGTYWVYTGYALDTYDHEIRYEYGPPDDGTLRVEVLDSVQQGGLKAALFSAFPTALDWREKDEQGHPITQRHALVIRQKDGAYRIAVKQADEIFAQLKHDRHWKAILDKIEPEDYWLQDPPAKLGEKDEAVIDEATPRTDDWYCWVVTARGKMRFLNVRGVPMRRSLPFSTVSRFMGPDEELLNLVPGIGITKYDYVHHGTVMEQHVQLLEFGKKSAPLRSKQETREIR